MPIANTYRQLGLLALGLALTLVLAMPGRVAAATASEIDAKVATTLAEFRKEVKSAGDYLGQAAAVLVVPDVTKVGLVVAAQWGSGALQIDGRSVEYYKMEAGSAGFQGGYQKADFVFVFFTKAAVDKFREGSGWTVGAETGLTLVEVGAGIAADTLKNQGDVAAFAFGREGLMAGWSAKGTKFTRFDPER